MKNSNGPVLLASFLISCILPLITTPDAAAFTVITQGVNGGHAVVAGGDGSVALKNDGTVVAWGNNLYDQTVVPEGLTGVTALAAGGYHLAALKNNGMIVAWGNNLFEQATVPSGLIDVTSLSAGYYHTVALQGNGTVIAWGRNDLGQSTVPVVLDGVTDIAAGGYHTVARKDNGTVVAWGDNSYGQTTIPAGLSGVEAIAAGSLHTVALLDNGTVIAWGDNGSGQATVPTGLGGVTSIAAGLAHTVAVKSDGTVVAWGGNSADQSTVPTGLSGVIAIAAGDNHTLALKNDGTVVAWGDNGSGQTTIPVAISGDIANGSVTCTNPVTANATSTCTIAPNPGYHLATFMVNGVDRLADVHNNTYPIVNVQQNQIVVGAFALTTPPGAPVIGTATAGNGRATVTFSPPATNGGSAITGYTVTSDPGGGTASGLRSPITVAGLTNGVPYTFTIQATNAIGTGAPSTASNSVIPVITHTVRAQGLDGARSIASGGRHSVALKNDGSLISWGENNYGQTTTPQALTGIIAIAAGDSHTVALKGDGTVKAWGNNSYGQTTIPAGLDEVRAISAGWYHTVALKGDGTAIAWGGNGYGQASVPSGLSDVTAIAAGAYLSVALKNDGTVIAWGKNGQNETATLSAISGLTSVAPGWAHAVALKSTGAVVAWGLNLYGLSTVPAGLSWVTAITSGYLHSVALQDNGSVVAWGNNTEGQTTPPAGLSGVETVAAGDNHTVALKSDGSLIAWGDNTYGQTSIPAEIFGGIANGAVSCVSPVEQNASSTCTIVPSPGYHLATFSVNGTDRLADISNGNFTIVDIQQEQTILASFATVPGSPTIDAVWVDNGQAHVAFTPPGSNGGSPITDFTVTASPGDVSVSSMTSPITVSGLPAGITYTFTVAASNAFGVGAASVPSSPVLVYDPNGSDFDADLIPNQQDNCLFDSNNNQLDSDYDGVGDACDPFPSSVSEWRDSDDDGVGNNLDNCVAAANPLQADSDHDALGDACDHNPLPNYGSVVDAPHNQTSGITCSDCHSHSLWWRYAPLALTDLAYEATTNAVCGKCHGLGGTASQAIGHSSAAMGQAHRIGLGDWKTKCIDCHDPHLQAQLHWASNPTDAAKLYLATGIIGNTFTVTGGQTTFSYTLISALPEWSYPSIWQRKNATLPPNGLILVDNKDAPANNTFKVLAADANTITVRGGLDPTSQGRTFGIIYGQMIKSTLLTPALTSRSVKFFNPSDPAGGYTDSNTPSTGLCQVCHQATTVWDDNGTGDAPFHSGHGNTHCTDCHSPAQGFAPTAN